MFVQQYIKKLNRTQSKISFLFLNQFDKKKIPECEKNFKNSNNLLVPNGGDLCILTENQEIAKTQNGYTNGNGNGHSNENGNGYRNGHKPGNGHENGNGFADEYDDDAEFDLEEQELAAKVIQVFQ